MTRAIELLSGLDDVVPSGPGDSRSDPWVDSSVHNSSKKCGDESAEGLKPRNHAQQALIVIGVQIMQGRGEVEFRNF